MAQTNLIRQFPVGSLTALVGGFLQIGAALTILFLPVIGTCEGKFGGSVVCTQNSYLSLGGNALGYIFLILMLVVGIVVMMSTRDQNQMRVRLMRWLAVLISLPIIVIAGFSFGFAFAPGALFILISAIFI